jgi:hypothetical protein
MHRHAVEYSICPRGPRSGPGCSVPVRPHLIGPIRPTRRRTAISPHGGLARRGSIVRRYQVPSAHHERGSGHNNARARGHLYMTTENAG